MSLEKTDVSVDSPTLVRCFVLNAAPKTKWRIKVTSKLPGVPVDVMVRKQAECMGGLGWVKDIFAKPVAVGEFVSGGGSYWIAAVAPQPVAFTIEIEKIADNVGGGAAPGQAVAVGPLPPHTQVTANSIPQTPPPGASSGIVPTSSAAPPRARPGVVPYVLNSERKVPVDKRFLGISYPSVDQIQFDQEYQGYFEESDGKGVRSRAREDCWVFRAKAGQSLLFTVVEGGDAVRHVEFRRTCNYDRSIRDHLEEVSNDEDRKKHFSYTFSVPSDGIFFIQIVGDARMLNRPYIFKVEDVATLSPARQKAWQEQQDVAMARRQEAQRQANAERRRKDESRDALLGALYTALGGDEAVADNILDPNSRSYKENEQVMANIRAMGEADGRRKEAEAAAQRETEAARQAQARAENAQRMAVAQAQSGNAAAARQAEATRQIEVARANQARQAAQTQQRLAQQERDAAANAQMQMRNFTAATTGQSGALPSGPSSAQGSAASNGPTAPSEDGQRARWLADKPSGDLRSNFLSNMAMGSEPPGEGELSSRVTHIGGCQASSVRVEYDLDLSTGEPTVSGAWSWEGDSKCTPPRTTKVWLMISRGSAYGYVELNPSIPPAGGGFGVNSTGSPSWRRLVCGFYDGRASSCLDAADAKTMWMGGKVQEFLISW